MANIKSAKKRILVIETKTLRNKSIKSKVKTEISKATSKGIFHKNTAARKVSRLTKAVNGIA